jgi:hypothetical protein
MGIAISVRVDLGKSEGEIDAISTLQIRYPRIQSSNQDKE